MQQPCRKNKTQSKIIFYKPDKKEDYRRISNRSLQENYKSKDGKIFLNIMKLVRVLKNISRVRTSAEGITSLSQF